jgi:hypothetical protein
MNLTTILIFEEKFKSSILPISILLGTLIKFIKGGGRHEKNHETFPVEGISDFYFQIVEFGVRSPVKFSARSYLLRIFLPVEFSATALQIIDARYFISLRGNLGIHVLPPLLKWNLLILSFSWAVHSVVAV